MEASSAATVGTPAASSQDGPTPAHRTLAPFGAEWVADLARGGVGPAAGDARGLDAQLRLLETAGISVSAASASTTVALALASQTINEPPATAPGDDAARMAATLGPMRAARVRDEVGPALLSSRMWEQGTALANFATRGAALGGPRVDGRAGVRVVEARGGVFGERGAGVGAGGGVHSSNPRIDERGGCSESSAPWADALHTQIVPQAWLNSYPLPIARQLLDVVPRGDGGAGATGDAALGPLHAAYTPGDLAISFSGCTAYFTQAACEDLWGAAAASIDAAFDRKKGV